MEKVPVKPVIVTGPPASPETRYDHDLSILSSNWSIFPRADLSTLSVSSSLAAKRNFSRVRKISIVEEEEDEEEDVVTPETKGMPVKGLSRHSSTSSLVDKPSAGDKIPLSPQVFSSLFILLEMF